MIRILIVDDHPVVREGLALALGDLPDMEVAGAAGTAEEGLRLAGERQPDVVLLDLELPGTGGLAALPGFLQEVPEVRILIFTAYAQEERVLQALRGGASGFLLKGASLEEIARAVRAVHSGGTYLEPTVAARAVREAAAGRRPPSTLSDREREVLRLVARGQGNKQIARALGIAERTVKFHLGSILQKLGAENRAGAVAVAAERGLI